MTFGYVIKRILRFILKPVSFVPVILVAYMIFTFSAQNGTDSSALSRKVTEKIVRTVNVTLDREWSPAEQEYYVQRLEPYVRKTAHFSEFCLFAFTLSIPLYVYGARGFWLYFWIILLSFGYACTDEYHQMFTSGRSPGFRDVLIDTSGAILGTLIAHPFLVICAKTIFRPLALEKSRKKRRR